jgi:hypothetical protein
MPDDDRVASALAGIRAFDYKPVPQGHHTFEQAIRAAHDVPVLLAAIEAVLKEHAPVDRGRVMRCCEGCEEVNGEFHEDCCHEWPCPTVAAITTALTGKEAAG